MASRRTLLVWDEQDTPLPLQSLLNALEMYYPIAQGSVRGAVRVEFAPGGFASGVEVTLNKRHARIAYEKPFHAARGIGALLAELVQEGVAYREQTPFESFGIMLDCSRNAVMTVEHFEGWLRQLALLGYNQAMLYTEDTYELPGEPHFGYLRGRYSAEELRQIDDYAASLGIEMIGCIQTLGHLEQILKWATYRGVKDTERVILADEDASYALIEKMIAHYAANFRSRRIHIGMDEAHDLGRGLFMDRFGYQRGYDIFNRHLARVIEICKKHTLAPMIWSDMYFRMGSATGDYYDKNCSVPEDVKQAIPRQAELVYWDYYHDNEEFYLDWIARHRALGFEPVMASGVWTWALLWHGRPLTEGNGAPCVRASCKAGLKEFFFTLWGDDGGYCEFDSALAGLAYGAELAFDCGQADENRLSRRYQAVCGGDYQQVQQAAGLNEFGGAKILWDDPLLGIFWKARKAQDASHWTKAAEHFASLAAGLAVHAKRTTPVDMAHAAALAQCLHQKVKLGLGLESAYASRNREELKKVAEETIAMVRCIDRVLASFRRQWLARNKSFGFETIQLRLGGLKQRYAELRERIEELLDGRIGSIEELEQDAHSPACGWTWRAIASSSSIL